MPIESGLVSAAVVSGRFVSQARPVMELHGSTVEVVCE